MAGIERFKDQPIQVESWRVPGRLEITIGVNGTAETFVASFSDGLDPRFSLFDSLKLFRLVNAVQEHKAWLLAGTEPIGLRRLRLCQYTTEELVRIIDSRTQYCERR